MSSFSQTLIWSNITKSYLGIPKKFRDTYMPMHDETVTLVDENGREYYVGYSAKGRRIVSGWRDFVVEHGLLEGDTVDFHLVDECECRFKVVITRESGLRENEYLPLGFAKKRGMREGNPGNITGAVSCQTPLLEFHPATFHDGVEGRIRKMNSMVKLKCGNILRELMSHSYGWIFSEPVDPVKLNLPNYFLVIKKPMDLGTVKHKLDENGYSNMEEFAADVRLTFSNALLYNPPDHEIYEWAELFNDHFNNKWKSLEAKLKHQGATTASDPRKSCEGNRKWEIVVHKGGGKVHPVKMVEKESRFAVNNVQKDLSSRKSAEHISGDSKMMQVDRHSQIRKRVRPREKENHVFITRKQRSTKSNGAYGISNLNIHASDVGTVEKEIHEVLDMNKDSVSKQSHSFSKNDSELVLNFKDVKGFNDFKIHSNGINLDSEIPLQIQRKYYELCRTQKEFLHADLTKGLNSKLVAEMITEMICIADATRAATISTSFDYLEQMDKTLKFFEGCGMTVGFLRVRLHSLVKHSRAYLTASKVKRTKLSALEAEKTIMHEEMSKMDKLMESITSRGESIGSLEAEIGVLEEKTEGLEKMFNEVTDSPFVCLV